MSEDKEQPMISFTAEKVQDLRRAYNHAIETRQAMFVFEGRDFLVAYTRYLLEHLSNHFPPAGT